MVALVYNYYFTTPNELLDLDNDLMAAYAS